MAALANGVIETAKAKRLVESWNINMIMHVHQTPQTHKQNGECRVQQCVLRSKKLDTAAADYLEVVIASLMHASFVNTCNVHSFSDVNSKRTK